MNIIAIGMAELHMSYKEVRKMPLETLTKLVECYLEFKANTNPFG